MFNPRYIYPIGIDIGEHDIYAAQLGQTRQGYSVGALAHRALEANAEDESETDKALVALLKKMIASGRFRGRRAAVHLPSRYLFSFPLRFQVKEDEIPEGVMLRELRGYLSFPLEEAVVDYPSLLPLSSDETGQYKAIVTATRKGHVERYMGLMKRAGLVVDTVDLPVCSLIRLHNFLHGEIKNPILLCHIGRSQSLLSVVEGEGILAEHSIAWGIERPLKKIMTNLELTEDRYKAWLLLKRYGLIYESQKEEDETDDSNEDKTLDDTYRIIYQIIVPHMEELLDEFHKMIGYLRSEERHLVVEGIFIYGEGALIHRLDHYIEGRLHIPAKAVHAMDKFDLSGMDSQPDNSESAPFALALGLAMRKVTWL